MTASRGIGRGNNSGGRNPGAGRPRGALNKRVQTLIAQAEREGQLLPVDYLLEIMRNPEAAQRDRIFCAVAAAPYMHPRLTALRVFPDPRTMDDATLIFQIAHLEQRAAAMPEHERAEALTAQFEHLLEDLPRLPTDRREAFLRKLAEAAEVGLQQLNGQDLPGTGPSPPNGSANGLANPDPAAPADRVFEHDRTTGELRRVSK